MNDFPVVLFSCLMAITAISVVGMVVLNSEEALSPALVAIGVIGGYVTKSAENTLRGEK